MSSFEEHCWESIALFGESFAEAHIWLDAFMGTPKYGMRHRRARHHEKGVRIIASMFGEKAALAARQHIISDLRLDGWKEGDPFSKDEEDFRRIGFFLMMEFTGSQRSPELIHQGLLVHFDNARVRARPFPSQISLPHLILTVFRRTS